jgi:transcriptional regulator with XRE-family HTH domain
MTREEAKKNEAELRRRLAENVRRLRKAKRLTIQEAAARAEIHWRMWQKVESRQSNATLFTLARLANPLDVDPKDLLYEPPPEVSKEG